MKNETVQGKTLSERFQELDEIPDGFHDDPDGTWARIEPELAEFNAALAPKRIWRPYRLYAAAAAIALLVMGILAGMLSQSRHDNRLLEMALAIKYSNVNHPKPTVHERPVVVAGETPPDRQTINVSRQPDQNALVANREPVLKRPSLVTPETKQKTPDLPGITPGLKNDSIGTTPAFVPPSLPENLAVSNMPQPKNKLRLMHRNQPYSIAGPAQQAGPDDKEFYAFGFRYTRFHISANKEL